MSDMVPLMGIETEYGIIREDMDHSDPVEESMQLLRSYPAPSVFNAWSYAQENSHMDLRGFTVDQLAQDEEEDQFCAEDKKRPYSYLEMKSDRVLTNGARFYNDHTHPEYSTPECHSVLQLAAHDAAGEKIVGECVRLRNLDLGGKHLQVFKNNTDYSGHSYGTHDNYLIPRKLSFEQLVRSLVPFLVTRQLYAGAGKVGSEARKLEPFVGLQLAQRSDFIETLLSIETMTHRPIINTRDEPHAQSSRFRRLHLILGDANMSPYATALKLGATRLVLTLIAEDKIKIPFLLKDPVHDIKRISRDLDGKIPLTLESGKTVSPLAIQEWFLDQAQRHGPQDNQEWDWVLREWGRTLDDLKSNPERLSDRIDWAIKLKLYRQFMATEKTSWDDPWLQSLDLEYHNLDPERGLYHALEQEGEIPPLFLNGEVLAAQTTPPAGTRAMIRGKLVQAQGDRIKKIHWTGIEFKDGKYINLNNIITASDVEQALNQQKEQLEWT